VDDQEVDEHRVVPAAEARVGEVAEDGRDHLQEQEELAVLHTDTAQLEVVV
jgi:hypothetical protein